MESTNAKKSEFGAYYNVSVEFEQMDGIKEGKLAAALSDPDTANDPLSVGLGESVNLSESAMASALSAVTNVADNFTWQDLAALA